VRDDERSGWHPLVHVALLVHHLVGDQRGVIDLAGEQEAVTGLRLLYRTVGVALEVDATLKEKSPLAP
jgi:hypothetical protein